jgi:Pyruvate/2-oxoacid:ferredoxin oxidoreductase delta subunit
MITAPPSLRVVLYEGAGSGRLPDGPRFELMRTLLEKGYAVTAVRDGGAVSPSDAGTLLVLGLFGTTVPPHIGGNGNGGHNGDGVNVLFRDIGGTDLAAIVAHVEQVRGDSQARKPGGWKPWFPVIDYGRCTNCMQCLSFCLFDVYGVSADNKIQVQKENNCKTDCPACSRVCPEVAILFPKYRFGPINGDEINQDDLRREAMKVDISALLGGDIYQALRDRTERAKSRFSKERDEDRALKERNRCLEKLKAMATDIPAEVLASLPSPDQIKAKADAAKARAEAALARAADSPGRHGGTGALST